MPERLPDARTPLPPDALRRRCDPATLGDFATTATLPDLPDPPGQERALEALELALAMPRPGFHCFAFGAAEVDVAAVVGRLLARRAADAPTPPGWVYVHDFADPQRPRALALPPGRAPALRAELAALVDALRTAIPAAFESEQYRTRARVVEEEVKDRHQQALEAIEARARAQGIAFVRTPLGMGFAPLDGDEVMAPEAFQRLPDARRQELAQRIEALQAELQTVVAQFPQWQREGVERVRALDREVTSYAVAHLIDALRARWTDLPAVAGWLDAVAHDVVEHADLFRRPGDGGGPPRSSPEVEAAFRRYEVNVLVDHAPGSGAPVVDEPNPTYPNLVGRAEHRAALGALVTDHTLVRAGALHRASGGYLVLDARRTLLQPWAWDGLKQALRAGRVRIESPAQVFSLVATVSLEPEPIPLVVKVVLVGDPLLYWALHRLDPDVGELFKIPADFGDSTARTPDTVSLHARLLATRARAAGLRPLERDAVARVVEEAARLAGDAERLSTHTRRLDDLLAEADHHAGRRGAAVIAAADVDAARDAAERRVSRLREDLLRETCRGTLLIDTAGARVGQVNGLSVLALGGVAFGRPVRLTARVHVGTGAVLDIEREVALGGPLHSKGVLILGGFLAARFGGDEPPSLAATLVFEQSYGGVEGDSASLAELCALLSALGEVPVAQRFAVTGSVNQHGDVQAVGGVDEKVEGFFDLCAARGLDGTHGVIVPAANVARLMLRPDVVAAVAAGRFAVHAVATVDEAVTLLTGVDAGVADAQGRWPEGSVNRAVADRLHAFAAARRRHLLVGDGATR